MGTARAIDTLYRLSIEIDFSPRSTSPTNLPLRDDCSLRRSWLKPRCLRCSRLPGENRRLRREILELQHELDPDEVALDHRCSSSRRENLGRREVRVQGTVVRAHVLEERVERNCDAAGALYSPKDHVGLE
jgi:hypothetical protein